MHIRFRSVRKQPDRSRLKEGNPSGTANRPTIEMEKLQNLKEVMDAVSKDSTKFFEKGNKAAGTRARKNLQELKKLAQELRVAIQDTKANMSNPAAE